MEFLQPGGAFALASLGIILALYFLRRRYVDAPVSSTLLWRRALEEPSASRPFQRLKRNPLLPLQLLIAVLLSLALMRPALPGELAGETVMIFDLSASMQAETAGKTRLSEAVTLAYEKLDALAPEAPLTLLAVDSETRQLLSRSTDRQAARDALSALRPGNTGADLSAALSLARAMDQELGGVRILVFSDQFVAPAGVQTINSARGAENRALLSLSAAGDAAVARIANYGGAGQVTVECYAGDTLCDAKRVSLSEGESLSLRLAVPEDAGIIRAVLAEKDAIAADNTLYCVRRAGGETVVALAGSNTFLEHALTLRQDVRLLRTPAGEFPQGMEADVYVRDGDVITFSQSPEAPPVTAAEARAPEGAPTLAGDAATESLTKHLSLTGIALRTYRPLTGGTPFLRCDGKALGVAGEGWAALGFDLHDSNLPLKYDFPLLIQNLLAYLAPEEAGIQDGVCGQTLMISAAKGEVETPSGQRIFLPENGQFSDTSEAGLYIFRTEEKTFPFALRMEPAESDVRAVAPSTEGSQAAARAGQRELAPWLLALAFLLILLEGGVSRRVG